MIESLRTGPEKNFCYIIYCPKTLKSALVDPAFELDKVLEWAVRFSKTKENIVYLLATHGHWDHAGGFLEMKTLLPWVKIAAHESEAKRMRELGVSIDAKLQDESRISVGKVEVTVLHTPGHTEGGVCYVVGDQILTGDTLFVGQCGRTDLSGGSDKQLFESLQKLKTLPESLAVRPGHDYGSKPVSTLGEEKRKNPTMMARNLEEFINLP